MKIRLICSNTSSGNPDATPIISNGDVITYRGLLYDFSPLPEGAELQIGEPFFGVVKRVAGQIELSLQYFYSSETAETIQSLDSNDYIFIITDGQCPDPIKRKPVEVVNEPTPTS
jgi:hypothetical protein